MPANTETMQAIQIQPDPERKYSATDPAPVSALHLSNVPIPSLKQPGDVLVRVYASTVIRDMLTWPEMLEVDRYTPGSDFSGVVVSSYDSTDSKFRPGDEVYGFVFFTPDKPGTWAQYSVIKQEDLALKPKVLSWEEAASVPLSALTAYQALFHHAHLDSSGLASSASDPPTEHNENKRVLITGATGALGLWLVQMASRTGVKHVIAVTSSPERSRTELTNLGATAVIHYDDLSKHVKDCHVLIDTAGGSVLPKLWACAAPGGTIVSVDSFTRDFVAENRKSGNPREDVNGVWFIVEPNFGDLSVISNALQLGQLKTFVDQTFPLADVRAAYEAASKRSHRRGKVVITVSR